MPRLVPASSLVSPAVSIRGSQLRAGPAEHLQPCQHQHPAAAGGAPREQHLPVPPPGSHWSATALSLPRALIGQRQLCPSPGVSLLSGSSARSHWLSRRARERPLGAGSVRRGCRQRSAAPAARAAPQESAASAGAVRAAASRKPRHKRERVLRTAPPEVCGRTGPGEAPCTAPSTLPSPPVPRGTPVGLGCGL